MSLLIGYRWCASHAARHPTQMVTLLRTMLLRKDCNLEVTIHGEGKCLIAPMKCNRRAAVRFVRVVTVALQLFASPTTPLDSSSRKSEEISWGPTHDD